MNNESTPYVVQTSFLRDMLFIVFKRKIPLMVLLVLGVLIVGHGVRSSVPEYEARARVMVRRTRSGYQMPTETQAVLKRGEVVNTELQIIMSAAVAEAVVDSLGLAESEDRGMTIARLEKQIKARALPESDIIDITYRHRNPEMAARIVNAALDAYLGIRKGVALSTEAVAFLEMQATHARAMRDSLMRELAKLGAEQGAHSLGRRVEQQMTSHSRYREKLREVTEQIDTQERQLAVVEEWLASGRDISGTPQGAIYNNEGVTRAHSALVDLGISLGDARARYTPDHPEVLRIERAIASTETILRDEIVASINAQRLRIEELRAQEQAIENVIAELRAADTEVAETEFQLRILQHDISMRVDLYELVVGRMEQFRITTETDPDLLNVAVVSRAAVPVRATPRPVNMRVVVGLFTIVFGLLLVFVMERMDQSLERRDDVQRYLGVKVLASIPDRKFHPRGR